MTREQLVEELSGRIQQGTPRLDFNALYYEDFGRQVRYLTIGELHKLRILRDALDTPELRGEIAALLAKDIQNTKAEVGGLGDRSENRLRLYDHDSTVEGDLRFSLPEGIEPLLALVEFHLHGGDTPQGSPLAAGPSSNATASGGDRGSAWGNHQDGVVITHLRPGRINVDFYTPFGGVIDLGDFDIPAATTQQDRS